MQSSRADRLVLILQISNKIWENGKLITIQSRFSSEYLPINALTAFCICKMRFLEVYKASRQFGIESFRKLSIVDPVTVLLFCSQYISNRANPTILTITFRFYPTKGYYFGKKTALPRTRVESPTGSALFPFFYTHISHWVKIKL